MKKVIMTLAVLAGITATAQVKVGSNVTTIDVATTNFQVEGTTTAEQFVILKNGKVGIGTTAPTDNLEVRDGVVTARSSSLLQSAQLTSDGGIELYRDATGSSNTINGFIDFKKTATSDNDYRIAWNNSLDSGSGGLVFQPSNVFILNSGSVGIGTITPAQKLHVVGSIQMVDGNQGAGKVMVSDAAGKGTWTAGGLPVVNATPAAVAATGDVYVDPNGGGVIVKDTAGVKWRITVSTTGILTTTATSN